MSRPWYIDRYQWPELAPWKTTTRSPILRFAFNRGSTEPIPIRFIDAGVVQELGSTATVGFGLKETRQSTSWLITPVSAAKTGTTTATVYTLSPQFMGDTLDTLLGSNDSAMCVLEIYWTDSGTGGTAGAFGTGSIQKDCRVYRNLNVGGETVPTTPSSYSAVTPSATGSVSISAAGLTQATVSVISSAGSGTYTYKVVLLTTGVTAGALADVYIQVPASANPTIEVRNATTAGTTLHSVTGDSSNITYQRIGFRFNGTAWVKFGPGELA
jgi:hypothetical protein